MIVFAPNQRGRSFACPHCGRPLPVNLQFLTEKEVADWLARLGQAHPPDEPGDEPAD
jgi:hypothetical protein